MNVNPSQFTFIETALLMLVSVLIALGIIEVLRWLGTAIVAYRKRTEITQETMYLGTIVDGMAKDTKACMAVWNYDVSYSECFTIDHAQDMYVHFKWTRKQSRRERRNTKLRAAHFFQGVICGIGHYQKDEK